MKIIWKIKRFLLQREERLVRKRHREGTINYKEYCEHMERINDRYWELWYQAGKNGWQP